MVSPTTSGCFIGILASLLLLTANAQPVLQPLSPLLATLSDEAGVLSFDEGLTVSRSLEDVFDKTCVRVILVIAETTASEDIADYAERLAQRWKSERHIEPERAIFVVFALDQREMQIMLGKSLPATIEQRLAVDDAFTELAPLLRDQLYVEAIMPS